MTQNYEQLIVEGIKGLPPEILAEIADFVYFVRQRAIQPQAFEEELRSALLTAELRQSSRDEEAHLEKEFEDYCSKRERKVSYKVNVVIEKDEYGYYAYCPELEGCQTQGDTLEKVLGNIREAIELYLGTLPKMDLGLCPC